MFATREEMLRTLIVNNYDSHHKEIFLAVANLYTDFNQVKNQGLNQCPNPPPNQGPRGRFNTLHH